MTMANYSFDFGGFTIGNGTNYLVTNVEGLGGTSPLRIQDDNRGYLDGSYSGRDFYDERTVYIDVTVLAGGGSTAGANYQSLQAAFAPQPLGYYPDPTGYTPPEDILTQFDFKLTGSPQFTGDTGVRTMWGRSRGLTTPIDPDFTYGYIKTRIMLSFPDPRYYSANTQTTYSNVATMTNHGWAISCPVIDLTANATSGYVTDGANNMNFTGVSVGDVITINLLTRVVSLNDVPARNILGAASAWLQLDPNSTTTFTSSFGNMIVSYASAYI